MGDTGDENNDNCDDDDDVGDDYDDVGNDDSDVGDEDNDGSGVSEALILPPVYYLLCLCLGPSSKESFG